MEKSGKGLTGFIIYLSKRDHHHIKGDEVTLSSALFYKDKNKTSRYKGGYHICYCLKSLIVTVNAFQMHIAVTTPGHDETGNSGYDIPPRKII